MTDTTASQQADPTPPHDHGTTTVTPPPASTSPPTTTPPQETHPKDPRIAALHSMFPDYDELILYSVLDSVGGDQDRAIDALLGMSDPEYKPSTPAVSEPVAQGQGQGGDTMAEIQQQLGKFAETGKRTFGTLFNKVKAKIQEMDQPKYVSHPSRASDHDVDTTTPPRTGQSSSQQGQTWDSAVYEQNTYQSQTQQPNVPYATRPSHAHQPAYYDPNANESPRRVESPPVAVQGYDAGPASVPAPRTTPPPLASTTTTSASASNTTPFSNDTPRAAALTSPPIDGGKFGILPKRPVALLRPDDVPLQRQHSQQSQDESDDGLEYAESPFEETKPSK
ncbi:hypothetical protein C0991_004693 [Blastosporella zonata]|nr:hypothetical protein C0991_004693 [Blastosporella zonata]